MPSQDPRDIVTPDAFSVAPHLLGLPLARPWRRLLAMLVDLVLIALLAHAAGILFALAAGVFLFWLALRGRKSGATSRVLRGTLGCLGAMVLFISISVWWLSGRVDEDTVLFRTSAADDGGVPITLGALGDFTTLLATDDTAEAAAAAERVVARLTAQGISADQMREVLGDLREEADDRLLAIVDAAIASSDSTAPAPAPPSLDSLLASYTSARAAGDSVAVARWGPPLGARLAAEQLEAREQEVVRLTARNEQLETQLAETEQEVESERDRGIIQTIVGFLDELGLGIGWSGLYFTFLTGFFRGRTPGKRLLGVRVVRLDGKPISYWVAFERFGGYAASLFTGLEGFARILWDRNRQCLEDKLAETVVIRETKDVRARLAIEAAARSISAEPWQAGSGTGR